MVFVLVIWRAFSFLPPENNGVEALSNYVNETSVPSDEDNNSDENTVNSTSNDDNKTTETVNNANSENLDAPPVPSEMISEPAESETPSEEDNKTKAENYKKAGDYLKAAETYASMADAETEADKKADLYEAASQAYGMGKRYGTALSYAQRAYNLSPSTSREVLLARLYYKTGDIDKANDRMNNVLRRDFSADR